MISSAHLKEECRTLLPPSNLQLEQKGKIAEHIRRLPAYREAGLLFIAPGAHLAQVRINALLDQKRLLLPSPGLKKGFLLFTPNTIPFGKLPYALSFKGIEEYGAFVPSARLSSLQVDCAFVGAEAVDRAGGRLGDGLGFIDLALALLTEYGAFSANAPIIYAVAAENRVVKNRLPQDFWDIHLTGVVTQGKTFSCATVTKTLTIGWGELPKKRIKKVQPLWDLYCRNNPLTKAG